MIKYFKNDFRSVHQAMKSLSNGKIPTWGIVIWYILLAPIGIILLPFATIYREISVRIWARRFGVK